MRFIAAVILSTIAVFGQAGEENQADYLRSHYTKFEYRIEMRDGIKLFTAVYIPNEATKENTYPILLTRSPYSVGPYGADRYPKSFYVPEEMAREGYIFVEQDVRGRFMSEGEFVNMRPIRSDKNGIDESTDTYDTVEWLISHIAYTNGNVGIWGNSYLGFYTSYGIIDTHPAIKAAMPSAPIGNWFFDDVHHHGAFCLNLSFNFLSSFGVVREGLVKEWPESFDHKTPDGYSFFMDLGALKKANEKYFHGKIPFWNEITEHPDYDEFWKSRNILPHLKGIRCAVLTVGGLYDAEDLYGAWNTYAAIEKQNPGISNTIVMGPWSHGAWLRRPGDKLGDADFGFATGEDFRRRVMAPYFRHYLKGKDMVDLPEAMVFETGANRWRQFQQWPPRDIKNSRLYLGQKNTLSWKPAESGDQQWVSFTSDPAHPVPYTTAITTGWHREYMTEDQRFASRRPDVLVFRSEPLAEDLSIAGPLEADILVKTTAGDADWVIKLIDEYPGRMADFDPKSGEKDKGGTQRLIRSEIFRGRYRNSYEHPEPFIPGQPTHVRIPLQAVLHTFKSGHRIMIQIQSSLFPFFDRNPQKFVPNIFKAREDDFIPAEHSVEISGKSMIHFSLLTNEGGLRTPASP